VLHDVRYVPAFAMNIITLADLKPTDLHTIGRKQNGC
jgi:hypothetical protein